MQYQYDAVGSALKMTQDFNGLNDKAKDATTTWAYDDRYRLTNETVVTVGQAFQPATNSTAYSWDNASNTLQTSADMNDYTDQWVHLVAVIDGLDTKIYFNGENVTTTAYSHGPITSQSAVLRTIS